MKSKRFTDIFLLVMALALGAMFIACQKEVSAAVVESIKSCCYGIIPSLFAMTVISGAIAKSGVLSRILPRSRLNADILTAFIFGNIGGYPVGAKLLCDMLDSGRITKAEAEQALCFCYGCGPAFAAGIAGAAVMGDMRSGLLAMAANVFANLTLYGVFLMKHKGKDRSVDAKNTEPCGFSTALMTSSVTSAAGTMLSISSMIVFFSALRAVLESLIPAIKSSRVLPALLEISNISRLADCKGASLVMIALLIGFGGICVHMQVLAIIGGKFSVKLFYFTRPGQLILSGIYAAIFQKLFHFSAAVEASKKIKLSRSESLIPIICVAAMVIISLCDEKINRRASLK